ncbi:GNAT family N-acetyltransferase [Streptomyces cocklensis]|uniref:Acetyltransferase involved in cellulose biosynthesis, CelD/BcsL family n=1 Tax=Actinacidiphila cocklensis TaxID=887465 RepID=A0A9W4GSU9_9ACTN|nr:GNAT family N-acetyltransferase [Actinacidiphila cocklensis]MDD1057130.1 GNAT family N-acetyltransferase [Actinacidiphila cocklensis]CAG6395136.1 Acetyltransferase involved in cellulose biosynthesis, CelD/BcsL family [Actinacidiphila cocklensis]
MTLADGLAQGRPGTSAAAPDQGRGHTGAGDLAVTVCRDPREFAALAAEWAALHGRCTQATPFQSHAWLHSWWLSYATRRDRLRVVLVHRQGVLVGAAPLLRTYRPLPVVRPLGGRITDYTDVLVSAAGNGLPDAEVTAALTRGVRRAARGAVVDLPEVRPGGAALAMYEAWRGPKRRAAASVCLELPGLPMDGLIARVGSSQGQRIRAKLRKLDAAGVAERDVPAHEVPEAVATLLRLHHLQWQGRGVTPEHVRPRFAEHLARAAAAMVAADEAVVTEFSIGGTVVAANLTVLSPAMAGGYLYGAHPDLRGTKIDVTTLLLRHGVRHTAGAGRPVLTLLRGAEPHKFHWRPEHLANERLLLAGRPLAPVLHARHALAAARTRLARAAAARLPALRAWRARLNDLRARRA